MGGTFFQEEVSCQNLFADKVPIYHCSSSENFEVIFSNSTEYEDVMLILAICCKLFPRIRLYSFQLMSNHFHFIVGGDIDQIHLFVDLFTKRLFKYMEEAGKILSRSKFSFSFHSIDTLEYLRNSIAYCNRNGFVVYNDVTPFSYTWGANSCFFNPIAREYYSLCRRPTRVLELRRVFKGKASDEARGLYCLNNIISPFSFCDIDTAERFFRNAKQYFFNISKNVEGLKQIGILLQESVIYSDEELYNICRQLAKDKLNCETISSLTPNNKLELAKELHFEYNAGSKQICRVLKLNIQVVDSIFGSSKNSLGKPCA